MIRMSKQVAVNFFLFQEPKLIEHTFRSLYLVSNLQRVDYEKKRHRILVTSDIHRHFMISNQKCQDQKKPQDEKVGTML